MSDKHYFTFGQDHIHHVDHDIMLDKDGVLCIEASSPVAARSFIMKLLGRKWAMQYTAESIELDYYPRGVILTIETGE